MPFPGRNFHFGRSKTNLSRFQKWKAKKKKKKKNSLHFGTLTSFHLQFSTFPFTVFLHFPSLLLHFPFFPCLFFPGRSVGQQKFPDQKSLRGEVSGGTLPPPPPPPVTTMKICRWKWHWKITATLKFNITKGNATLKNFKCNLLCNF